MEGRPQPSSCPRVQRWKARSEVGSGRPRTDEGTRDRPDSSNDSGFEKGGLVVKIRQVVVNNRKAQLELTVGSGRILPMPYAKLVPRPTPDDRIQEAYV